jgi:energy-coupling factor transporter ATP-binding protein EcfA2
MELLDEILSWSKSSLKPWQQDAVRRLFQKTNTASAVDDLYAMLKDSVGLSDPEARKPEPLSKHHLPISAKKGAAVTLLSLREIKNVNRLAPNQILTFSPKGLTIVYGGNGSGKSGYARILKRACRSRDANEDVRPNAHDKPSANATPQAVFEIEFGGNRSTVIWQKGEMPPAELATVAVFDTHCARAYLDQEQEVAYLPFGLDVVEGLAQILPLITKKLEAEIAATLTTKEAFNHLLGQTKVGALINALNDKTKLTDVEALAQMTVENAARMATLEKTLSESDPRTKAKALNLAAARITDIKKKIESAMAWVKDDAIQKLRTMDAEAETAFAVEIVAANELRAGEALLPGTGDLLWKTLFQAAQEFSIGAAYPTQQFPHTNEDSHCVLCQQAISSDAGERLHRFKAYIQENVAKAAEEKRVSRATAITKIENAVLTIELQAALVEELTLLDGAVVDEIRAFDSTIIARRTWLLSAQKNHIWEGIPELPVNPCVRLGLIAESITAEEQTYIKAINDKQKLALATELAELKARTSLSPHIKAISDLIDRMKTKTLLTKCRGDLNTRAISAKAKEFASAAVTTPLRIALQEEFTALDVLNIMPKLNESVERGKMKHKLKLDLHIDAPIRDILSEGEQRAIAIGSFLAELRTGGHGGGVIFDDPVSSLDHFRRKHVAQRLIAEAEVRQVIIFTHDTSFLGELNDLIEQKKVEHKIHYLEWAGACAGKINEGLPWHHQSFKDRIDKLQQAQCKLAKIWPPYPSEEQANTMREKYSLLRATIERLIQDVVFCGVVVRYRDWIKVGNLSDVVGFDVTECKEIERLHKTCCDVTEAHDSPSARNSSVPSAIQLGNDIAALNAVNNIIQERRKLQKKH